MQHAGAASRSKAVALAIDREDPGRATPAMRGSIVSIEAIRYLKGAGELVAASNWRNYTGRRAAQGILDGPRVGRSAQVPDVAEKRAELSPWRNKPAVFRVN